VGKLIYQSHTRPDIATDKGLLFTKHVYSKVEGYTDVDWVGSANNI
jgi:hypothetical protein